MDTKELRRYLNVIKRATSLIEGMLDADDGGLLEQLMRSPDVKPVEIAKPVDVKPVEVVNDGPSEEWLRLRAKHIQDLMHIPNWPEAVPNFNIDQVVDDGDQINRANAILDMVLDRKVMGMNFLDFGCGDGWIAKQMLERGVATSVGYDIKASDNWPKLSEVQFVNKLDGLTPHSFDVIMLYDVVDHCEDPVSVMSEVSNLLKFDGVIYVRCHPWLSMHGQHLYKDGLNKAYMHLFLTWGEIRDLIGKVPLFTRPEKRPLEAYRWWFSPFEVRQERLRRAPVHEFFLNPAFKALLSTEQQLNEVESKRLMRDMEIAFVDYVLCPKPIR
jgi:SAM-dependent methyltransferase